MSNVKEFLEYGIYEDLEPTDYYERFGLWSTKKWSSKYSKKSLKHIRERLDAYNKRRKEEYLSKTAD